MEGKMGSAEKQGRLWGAAVADWAELTEGFCLPVWEDMMAAMGVGPGTRFLDAGCGPGGGTKLAAAKGARVSGLDASDAMIAYARKRVPEGDFHVGDLEALPFEDNSFDAVMASNSVQYAENPVAALEEIRRVCSPEGKITVSTWDVAEKNEQRFTLDAINSIIPEPPIGPGPFALAEKGVLEALVEKGGLTVIGGGSTDAPFIYPDPETAWLGLSSGGPSQRVIQMVGADAVREALMPVYEKQRTPSGEVRFNNTFRFVTAIPKRRAQSA
jgi:SAM-dependent methyltransferase